MSTTLEQYQQVVEFMTVAGQEVNTNLKFPTTKVGKFRLSLIDEEMNGNNELFDSINKDDLNGILDGICDVLYVAYGALSTFGLEPINYTIPTQRNVPSTLQSIHHAAKLKQHVVDGYEQLVRGLYSGDTMTIHAGLNNIIYSVMDISTAHNFDLLGAFDEVHKSNMSKFCNSSSECAKSIFLRQNSGKVDYDGAEGFEVTVGGVSYFVIRRESDGKVLKGMNFFEPDLSQFINS